MPSPVFIGQQLQVPMVPNLNGGVDRACAVITEVGGEGANGGVMVHVRIFPNSTDLELADVVPVEFLDIEATARGLGFTDPENVPRGAWPLDYTYV